MGSEVGQQSEVQFCVFQMHLFTESVFVEVWLFTVGKFLADLRLRQDELVDQEGTSSFFGSSINFLRNPDQDRVMLIFANAEAVKQEQKSVRPSPIAEEQLIPWLIPVLRLRSHIEMRVGPLRLEPPLVLLLIQLQLNSLLFRFLILRRLLKQLLLKLRLGLEHFALKISQVFGLHFFQDQVIHIFIFLFTLVFFIDFGLSFCFGLFFI